MRSYQLEVPYKAQKTLIALAQIQGCSDANIYSHSQNALYDVMTNQKIKKNKK